MSMNELDAVAGGGMIETYKDSLELFERGLLDDHMNPAHLAAGWKNLSAKIDAAWAKAGIEVITKPLGGNVYKKDGKVIPREAALQHLSMNYKRVRE